MPYRHEGKKLLIPAAHDKRRRLTYIQREEIRENLLGLSSYQLAAKYEVSRRTIQFIFDPLKLEANIERRRERGGSKIYYEKEYHKNAMKQHRKHKHKLDQEGLLIKT